MEDLVISLFFGFPPTQLLTQERLEGILVGSNSRLVEIPLGLIGNLPLGIDRRGDGTALDLSRHRHLRRQTARAIGKRHVLGA